MIQTLLIYFSLEIAYKINSIMYHMHRMPLFRKVFAGKSYDAPAFKAFITAFAIMKEIFAGIIYKAVYFIAVFAVYSWFISMELIDKQASAAPVFVHIITLWTIAGAVINNQIFDTDVNSYYAVVLLRMDAKRYALTNYMYTMVRHIVGLVLFGMIFALIFSIPVYIMLLFPFYVVGVKIFKQSVMLIFNDFFRKNEKAVTAVQVCIALIAIAFSVMFPVSGFMITEQAAMYIMIAGILLGIIFLGRLITYDNYTLIYKRELSENMGPAGNINNDNSTEVEASRAAINDSAVVVNSKKSGFAYMNDLFVKRHRRLLWGTELFMTAAAVVLFAALTVLVGFGLGAEDKAELNHAVLYVIPRMLVFFMYALNRGTQYTQALFINCDHSLLTYSFYKERKRILNLFAIRLMDIIKVNLPIAVVIGIGLDVLLAVTGGTDSVVNYGVLVIAPICLSIFFSVHFLVMYYLLQPFDGGTNLASPAYKAVKPATYFVSFFIMEMELESLYFGIGTIVFCVLYCIAACVLVYIFAPRTCRIRCG